ncbi:MAG: hypothetical protein QXU32_12420 [Nitrososphaerales archaeon]
MNKLVFGMIVTGIPLAIAIGAVMGWYGTTGGILSPESRPDRALPPSPTIPVTIETQGGRDVLVNPGGRINPDFVATPYATLTLEITNKGQRTHTIQVPETGASSGPIAPGETKTLRVYYESRGDLTYRSIEAPDQINGRILYRTVT